MYKNLGEQINQSFQENEEYSTDFESDEENEPKTIETITKDRKSILSQGLVVSNLNKLFTYFYPLKVNIVGPFTIRNL